MRRTQTRLSCLRNTTALSDITVMDWLLLISGPSDPAYNMALDEALLENASNLGQPVLRFYDWADPAPLLAILKKLTK